VWLEEAAKTESGTEEGQTGNFCQQEIRRTSYLPSDKSSITSHAVPQTVPEIAKRKLEWNMACVCVSVRACESRSINISTFQLLPGM